MTTSDIKAKAKAWLQANRRKIITVLVLLALGFAAGSVLATDKPAPPPPPAQAPAPVVVDKWNGPDKAFHLAGGVMMGAVATVQTQSRPAGFAISCGAGLAFELLSPAWGGLSQLSRCGGGLHRRRGGRTRGRAAVAAGAQGRARGVAQGVLSTRPGNTRAVFGRTGPLAAGIVPG